MPSFISEEKLNIDLNVSNKIITYTRQGYFLIKVGMWGKMFIIKTAVGVMAGGIMFGFKSIHLVTPNSHQQSNNSVDLA